VLIAKIDVKCGKSRTFSPFAIATLVSVDNNQIC